METYTAKQAMFDTLKPAREQKPLLPILLDLIQHRTAMHRTSLFYFGLIPTDDIIELRKQGYRISITGTIKKPELIESYTITW